jgi:hypothetical protein
MDRRAPQLRSEANATPRLAIATQCMKDERPRPSSVRTFDHRVRERARREHEQACPIASSVRGCRIARLLDVAQRERDATMPTGRLTQKMLRHPASRPGIRRAWGPIAFEHPAIAAQMPMARAFAAGWGNAALTSASDVTFTVAAAAPWMPRAAFRTSIEGARPQADRCRREHEHARDVEAAASGKVRESCRRHDEHRHSEAVAATTHCKPASPTPKLAWMAGRPTFTISTSRKIMNRPRPGRRPGPALLGRYWWRSATVPVDFRGRWTIFRRSSPRALPALFHHGTTLASVFRTAVLRNVRVRCKWSPAGAQGFKFSNPDPSQKAERQAKR